MICRVWRGWAGLESAAAYEAIVRNKVIPGIESRKIQGFRHIDLLRREVEDGVEFTTLMWFDALDDVRNFMGEDYTLSHVPAEAQVALIRFDRRAAHHEVVDRRSQSDRADEQ